MGPFKIGFNEEWVKKVGRDKFLKHFKSIYPDHDLAAIYDEIVPPKAKDEPEKEEK